MFIRFFRNDDYVIIKLWYGEEWFMQIDSHMTFAQDWDALSIEMLENAPSNKPGKILLNVNMR